MPTLAELPKCCADNSPAIRSQQSRKQWAVIQWEVWKRYGHRKCLLTPGPKLYSAYELPGNSVKMQILSQEAGGQAWESTF